MCNAAIGADHYLPEDRSLGSLQAASGSCQGCPLFQNATQTVFGHGRTRTTGWTTRPSRAPGLVSAISLATRLAA